MRSARSNLATQRKYRRVIEEREKEVLKPNEIRIRASGFPFGVSVKIAHLLLDDQHPTVEISGTGPAIAKTATILDFLRKRVQNLHTLIQVTNVEIIDSYEPIEEGLDRVIVKRALAVMKVHFSLNPDQKFKNSPGYQSPLTVTTEDHAAFDDARKKYENGERRGPAREGAEKRGGERRRGGARNRGGRRTGGGRRRSDSEYSDEEYSRDRRQGRNNRDRSYQGGSGNERRRRPEYRDNRDERRGEGRQEERRGGDRRGGERRGEGRQDERRGGDRRQDERRGGDRRQDERRGGERRRSNERRGNEKAGRR